jgi:small subunit ribosomal protein S29
MSGSICLRCLARPAVGTLEQSSLRISTNATAAFSTSAALEANSAVKKKGVSVVKPGRGANASFSKAQGKINKGKAGGRTGKPPAEGERKAMRKRVVLSNTNAVEVQGLENFSAANVHDAALEGQVMGLSNEVIDALRATEAFKATQGWSLFRRPATLVRKETTELARLMQDVEANKTAVRRVIYGERASGKSVLALQAKAMALLKGWIVVHIPEGKSLEHQSMGLASILTAFKPKNSSSETHPTHPPPNQASTTNPTSPPPSSPNSQKQTTPPSPKCVCHASTTSPSPSSQTSLWTGSP